MALKGWIEACNHKGGIIRYLYDVIVEMAAGDSDLADEVDDIKSAIGNESTANSILGRIKALENAQTPTDEGHE